MPVQSMGSFYSISSMNTANDWESLKFTEEVYYFKL